MRPRYLEIEGLQSFKEVQSIDFDRLGEVGLFGIFGPTGSGKSTILDAITLALYGNVQRAPNRTQGIMNTDSANIRVLFEFDLTKSNIRKTYRVERVYRKKKDSENSVEARVTRLMEITPAGELMLADKQGEVNSGIVELIGLQFDDFTRSVVLPQNKFQEFLLSQKSEKTKMLERIFYLEEYGKLLTEKVRKKLGAVELRLSNLETAVGMLGDCSEKALEEAQQGLDNAAEHRTRVEQQLAAAEKAYGEAKEIWELSLELQGIEQKEDEQLTGKPQMDGKRRLWERAQKANEAASDIKAFREAGKNLDNTIARLEAIYSELTQLEKALAEAQGDYEQRSNLRKSEVPALIEQRTKLGEALAMKEEVTKLTAKLAALRSSYISTRDIISGLEAETAKEKQKLEANAAKRQQYKASLTELEINPEYKREMQQGLELEKEQEKASKDSKAQELKYEALKNEVESLEKELSALEAQGKGLGAELEQLRQEASDCESSKPDDRKELADEESALLSTKAELEAVSFKGADKEILEERLEALQKELEQAVGRLTAREAEKNEISGKLTELRQKLEQQKRLQEQNTAFMLAQALKEGEPCPVCGSAHHPVPAHEKTSAEAEAIEQSIKTLQAEEGKLDKEYRTAETDCIKLEEQTRGLRGQTEQTSKDLSSRQEEYDILLRRLPDSLQVLTPKAAQSELDKQRESLRTRLEAIEGWERQSKLLEEKLRKLEQQLTMHKIEESGKKAQLEVNRVNLEKEKRALEELAGAAEQKLGQYIQFINKWGIKNVRSELDRLEENDTRRTKLQKELESLEKADEGIRIQIDGHTMELQRHKVQFNEIESEGKTLKVQIEEKEQKIRATAGAADIKTQIEAAENRLKLLEQQEQQAEKVLETARDRHNTAESAKGTLENQREIYGRELEASTARLEAALSAKGFGTIEEAEQSIISKAELELLEKEITDYEAICKRLETQKEVLTAKLKGRKLTSEEWQSISDSYTNGKAERDESISQYESARNAYNNLKKNYDKWVLLDKDLKTYRRKKEMLEQIKKLLTGNAFIEFISEERLRYIAREASETLGVLTKYRYELELDSENGFVIKDNSNGGVRRLVSSLSGGETFLTSLSLALALSSHIQLKGQSPLEFFFLDEGFGTLDNNLLDTVIDSLERLSSTKRVIGLISHVPELRNRIPRRLIVEPATQNGKGSQLKIEKA